jgi:hypothetical protein
MNSQGYVIHKGEVSGSPFVVIATGFKRPTTNRKTGPMIQLWFLLEDENPVEVLMTGKDSETICQGCPFASGQGCYVNVGQAPLAVWKSYKNGNYPELHPKDYSIFNDHTVRFGAYGNPTLLPISKVKAIAKASKGWTGYFHNWLTMAPAKRKAYNKYFMASTETKDSFSIAKSLKLKVFHASDVKPDGTIECLADSHGKTCEQCLFCQGTNKKGKSVWINPHGSTLNRALKVINQ